MPLVKVDLGAKGTHIFEIPDFVHDFGDPTPHTFKGSLGRHITIEKLLYKIRRWLTYNDAIPGCGVAELLLDLLFGLNCGFPLKDIGLYLVWTLRAGFYKEVSALYVESWKKRQTQT